MLFKPWIHGNTSVKGNETFFFPKTSRLILRKVVKKKKCYSWGVDKIISWKKLGGRFCLFLWVRISFRFVRRELFSRWVKWIQDLSINRSITQYCRSLVKKKRVLAFCFYLLMRNGDDALFFCSFINIFVLVSNTLLSE